VILYDVQSEFECRLQIAIMNAKQTTSNFPDIFSSPFNDVFDKHAESHCWNRLRICCKPVNAIILMENITTLIAILFRCLQIPLGIMFSLQGIEFDTVKVSITLIKTRFLLIENSIHGMLKGCINSFVFI
jgi:hypothetical protein